MNASRRGGEVRWGVVGTGPIAEKVMTDLALTPGAVLHGVCSRTTSGAAAFAARHGAARTYTDPAALAADVDVVYVATPHTAHLDAATAVMGAGTAVLVEKPLTATLAGARRLVEVARQADVFCMEAMWTRFLPVTAELLDLLVAGEVGRPRALHASIGSVVPVVPGGRLHDPRQGGGALLDIGVYPVWLSVLLMGPVTSVAVAGEVGDGTGVDVLAGLLLGHEGGAVSLLSASMSSSAEQDAVLEGTRGRVRLEAPTWAPAGLSVVPASGGDGAGRTVRTRHLGAGYVHMLEHVQDCVRTGSTESPLHPLGHTLAVMEVLETALEQLGVRRPDEVGTTRPRPAA